MMFVQDSMDLQQNIGFHGKIFSKGITKVLKLVNFLQFIPEKPVPSTELRSMR